jgi:ectoine hydroxylase-related dioxygenase (phytanoyl-CoA dioxygenase family)
MEFPFHQDSKYRRFGTSYWKDINSKGSYVNIILAVDEMNVENSPLLLSENPKKHLGEISQKDQKRHSKIAKPVLLKPGDILVLGPYVIHGSLGNSSNKPRRIFINGFSSPGANSRKFDIPNAGELISLT